VAVDKVVKGLYFMLFQVIPELCGRSGVYTDGVFLFYRPHKGIVALAAQSAGFITGTDSLHAWCVFYHNFYYFLFI